MILKYRIVKYKTLIIYSPLLLCFGTSIAYAMEAQMNDLTSLSIEDLIKVEVTSPNKRAQEVTEIPSAIYVISSEDIHRSGATSIPEALRMAPGLNVARLDANKWSIGIRGNMGRFNNKLLVLIDGRSVYTPTFSGVYWEVQDLTLQDVEQIEVIRGPGGTIWGANAVNGVINIITKKAKKTTGLLASLTVGDHDKEIADLRYGDSPMENLTYRVYGKYLHRDNFQSVYDHNAQDSWHLQRAGMRVDWTEEKHKISLHGDGYNGRIHQLDPLPMPTAPFVQNFNDTIEPSGWNMVGHWEAQWSAQTSSNIQIYYDMAKREELVYHQKHNTLDIDASLNHILNEKNELTLGLGVRRIQDKYKGSFWMTALEPTTTTIYSGFIQDAFSIKPKKLILTLGSKIEHNDYTGFELQPNARLTWLQTCGNVAWTSYSQGVRTPSHMGRDADILLTILPPGVYIKLRGNKDFISEKLTAYEAGYRFFVSKKAYFDIAGFYNVYDKIRSNEKGKLTINNNHFEIPFIFQNNIKGHTFGYELLAQLNPNSHWEIKLTYAELRQHFALKNNSTDFQGVFNLANDSPRRTLSFFSKYTFAEKWDIDLWLKSSNITQHSGINALTPAIPGYLLADLRLAYKPTKNLTFSIVGQNLNKSKHIEGFEEWPRIPTDIPRAYYFNITYTS